MTRGPLALVRRIISEKRMLVGLVAIGLVVDAGLYVLAVYPWTRRVESADRRASAPDHEDGSLLARLHVSMLLSGAYRDIRRFIHAIETAPEFLIIDEIVLSQRDEAEAGEVLDLGLSTYYWQGDGDEP